MEVEFVNMRKLFPDKKITRKSFMEFLDKRGFYIVLILCVAIVGVTAILVTTNDISSSNPDYGTQQLIPEGNDVYAPEDSAAVDVEKNGAESSISTEGTDSKLAMNDGGAKPAASVKDGSQTASSTKTTKPAGTTQNKASSTKSTVQKSANASAQPAKAQAFVKPVSGDITNEFAQDKLIYSRTMEDWRAHGGIDIESSRGTVVKAVADGMVSEVNNDSKLGITVIIDHGNGLKSVYANLADDDMVTPNQILKRGDNIGCVGDTATFESVDPTHLHFEVWKDGKPVDPVTYLPK